MDKSISLPRNASYAPFNTCIRPCPPESTTPACFKTGNISGVCSNTSSAYLMTSSKKTVKSWHPSSASSRALWLAPFATVRMVPSLGFITALYAVSTAFSLASARSATVSSSNSLIDLVKPLKSWDKITPEFPRAPRKEPEEIALQMDAISISPSADTSLAAAMMVKVILVPVSPSGTGKTFKSLIHSFLDSKFFAPDKNIFASSLASIVLATLVPPLNQSLLHLQQRC